MKTIEITASYGRTIQFRQFEPINVHLSQKAEVDEEVSKEDKKRLQAETEELVREEISRLEAEREVLNLEENKDEVSDLIEVIKKIESRDKMIGLWNNTEAKIRRIKLVWNEFEKKGGEFEK